jgi:hypothetical protein
VAVSEPFGGTLGLTIMTTVFNNVSGMTDQLASKLKAGEGTSTGTEQVQLTQDAKIGVVYAFAAMCPFMVIVSINSPSGIDYS